MLNRKQTKAIQKFIYSVFKQFWQLSRNASRKLSRWLARNLLKNDRRQRRLGAARAGFVMPTVIMLLLVLTLVVGAILFRTGSRTNQVMSQRDAQIIYNAATPAIDRAKAKLEYLFTKETRLPAGVPSESVLTSILINDGQNGVPAVGSNPYKLPDETPIDINPGINPPGNDIAWTFQVPDNDGNPATNQTVAYSIIFKAQIPDPAAPNNSVIDARTYSGLTTKQKANQLIVRNGPISTTGAISTDCAVRLKAAPEAGWDLVSQASLRKTFQVTAVVVSNKPSNRTISTLEFQQDRELARGNKWGAWFRYDLEIFPGPEFKWNGAMHTEGSLIVGGSSVKSYLISSKDSCLYNPSSNSVVSVTRIVNDPVRPNFYGQVVSGRVYNNDVGGSSAFHIYGTLPISSGGSTEVNSDNDSTTTSSPSLVALDPVALFTRDLNQSNDSSDRSNFTKSTTTWKNPPGQINNKRIGAEAQTAPFVDDTYRADDRLGPKPKYQTTPTPVTLDATLKNGTAIASTSLSADIKEQLTQLEPDPGDEDFKTLGLDGYWERRARAQGLRVIVGQRLELGNTYGWGGTTDPLYPPTGNPVTHEAQQRRTLRDNLAAVQATAIYHRTQSNGYFPVAFLATTAHPGTATTIQNSTKFNSVFPTASTTFISNFFTGDGTNGWEYEVVPGAGESESDFISRISGGQPLRLALQNLANFAGDYTNANDSGAFPPSQQTSGNRVYPHPYLTMWGNFSNLKRALSLLDAGTPYLNLSIADKSYIHTAAGTVGMLAYNINQILSYSITPAEAQSLGDALGSLTGLPANPKPDDYIAKLIDATQQKRARLLHLRAQIQRDRLLGFAPVTTAALASAGSTEANYKYEVKYHTSIIPPATTQPSGTEAAYTFAGNTYDYSDPTKKFIYLGCDYTPGANGNNYFGLSAPTDPASEKRFIHLAVSLCSAKPTAFIGTLAPKYPSLYYLFPTVTHNDRNSPDTATDTSEPYITPPITAPPSANFQPVAIENAGIASQIMLRPKTATSGCNDTGWCLPINGAASITGDTAFQITDPNGSVQFVPFLDKGIFDGREMMSLRVLDIDLNRLRQVTIGTDTWFPASGIVYAFREDAVREDAISRPGNTPYTDATNANHSRTNARDTTTPIDPQLAVNGISPKPVDFYPDPDRRPYGFRLRNGRDLRRNPTLQVGLTFVSDNPVYIQGDFNLHSNNGTSNNIQEFDTLLGDSFNEGDFYNRPFNQLNENFASAAGDYWRPAEILADAITLLSQAFPDGSMEDGIRNSALSSNNSSYRSLNAPNSNKAWLREDGSNASASAASPIKISRNGNPFDCSTAACPEYTVGYDTFSTNKYSRLPAPTASGTQVNAILVSGIIPSQPFQSYGGFHNFPRFLEHWNNSVPLRISGSFMQLNFSTYATGLFYQQSWEPNENPPTGTTNNIYFYSAPKRIWGYDVGLQYAPPGALSKRFVTSGAPRSEFYEELPANDPYVCQLRKAIPVASGGESVQQLTSEGCS